MNDIFSMNAKVLLTNDNNCVGLKPFAVGIEGCCSCLRSGKPKLAPIPFRPNGLNGLVRKTASIKLKLQKGKIGLLCENTSMLV